MSNSMIRAARLRCEYQVSPVGVGTSNPRLYWWVDDPRPGAKQTAYRIRAATSSDSLSHPDVWDSGVVQSEEQAHLAIGRTLQSRQRVWWDVQLWDADGIAGPISEPAAFETGLLDRSDWSASLIGSPRVGTGQVGAAQPLLRKAFEIGSAIRSARLYVTALGLYEMSINGRRVGDEYLRPGWTDYHKRLNYQTYDVTEHLRVGGNAIGAMLGDGWYCGRVGSVERGSAWGDRPALLAQLEVMLADGTTLRVVTNGSWRWHDGPILNSDLIQGQEYDARLELAGWNTSGFDDGAWQKVVVDPMPELILEPSLAPPVRGLQEITAVAEPVKRGGHWGQTIYIYDFGQNLTGVLRLKVRGPRGCTLVMRHAEALRPDGTLDVSNLRSARAVDHYTFRGDPEGETYAPAFTLHGFRYAEVGVSNHWIQDKQTAPVFDRDTVKAVVLASDTPDTGTFECDAPLVNKLQSNIRWGMRGNFIEVPTDCPQRDERLGWTGDTQVFAPTAMCNAEVAGFYTKWMRDLADAQLANGAVPAIVPKPGRDWEWDGGAGWTDATVVVPWTTYQFYGDRRILEESYASIKLWIGHLNETAYDGVRAPAGQKGHRGFGDWLALDGLGGPSPDRTGTPKEFIATAHYAESLRLAACIADVLGIGDDARAYTSKHQDVVAAFNREFVTASGRLTAQSQTAHLLALAFDLLPEPHRGPAVEQLVELIREQNWHLTTGFLGTPLLCPVLTRFGRADVAYKLLLHETYPGWLYPVTLGATTMWERWNSWHPSTGFVETSMNSLNHYAYGAVGKWLFASVAGLDRHPDEPGYRSVLIRPVPGRGITRASASLDTIRGRVSVAWRIESGIFELSATLPANTVGTIVLPDGTSHEVAAGIHVKSCNVAPPN